MGKEHIVEHQFKKGTSGNPSGRPLGTRNRSTIVREMLSIEGEIPEEVYEKLKQSNPEISKKITLEEVMTIVQINKAIVDADTRAYTAVMDSAYGRTIDQTISDGTFEDTTKEELEEQFYLPPPEEDPEDIDHDEVEDSV